MVAKQWSQCKDRITIYVTLRTLQKLSLGRTANASICQQILNAKVLRWSNTTQ